MGRTAPLRRVGDNIHLGALDAVGAASTPSRQRARGVVIDTNCICHSRTIEIWSQFNAAVEPAERATATSDWEIHDARFAKFIIGHAKLERLWTWSSSARQRLAAALQRRPTPLLPRRLDAQGLRETSCPCPKSYVAPGPQSRRGPESEIFRRRQHRKGGRFGPNASHRRRWLHWLSRMPKVRENLCRHFWARRQRDATSGPVMSRTGDSSGFRPSGAHRP